MEAPSGVGGSAHIEHFSRMPGREPAEGPMDGNRQRGGGTWSLPDSRTLDIAGESGQIQILSKEGSYENGHQIHLLDGFGGCLLVHSRLGTGESTGSETRRGGQYGSRANGRLFEGSCHDESDDLLR